MNKKELREKYRSLRSELTVLEKDRLEDLVLIEFQKLQLNIPDVLMTYCPSHKLAEYDPVLVERYCSFRNPAVSFTYPVVNDEGIMDAVLADEGSDFVANRYGIDEPVGGEEVHPESIGMIFIPLLAYDTRGFRVGYGKGYYDRYLKRCTKDVLRIGFSFYEAEEMISDINEHDVEMDICITPYQSYIFKS